MLAALAVIELTARSTGSTAGSCARTVGPPVKVLATLRGVASLTGLVIVAEIGEVTRFDSASKLALGSCPSQIRLGHEQSPSKRQRSANFVCEKLDVGVAASAAEA